MPRLTNSTYLLQRARLRDNWINHDHFVFLELPVIEQMELHAYFAPMRELTDNEAIAFRKQATIERPYLPSRAGKVWAKVAVLLDHSPTRVPMEIRKKGQRVPPRSPGSRVIVKALVRPEIDTKRIAGILVQLAKDDLDREFDPRNK